MTFVKRCSYCFERITPKDRPYEIDGYNPEWKQRVIYDLCLSCRTRFESFKKTTIYDFIESKSQKCCTKVEDYCCSDHYPDDYEHECLHDIEQIVLE